MSYFLKYGTITTICGIFLTLYFAGKNKELNTEINKILASLRKAESKVVIKQAKVAVGFGGCKDVFVDAIPLFKALNIQPPNKKKHHSIITGEKDLAEGFAYFFKSGAAAERYISDKSLFDKIVKTALTMPGVRSALGGNAPVISNRLNKEGAKVLLALQGSDEFNKWIVDTTELSGPHVNTTDIHLIMEYKTNEIWGKYKSQRANRYIIHSDVFNPTIGSLEPFEKSYKSFDADLFVVSGLQMLDNFPFKPGQREERLMALKDVMTSSDKPLVHFELASFVDVDLVQNLMTYTVPHADSFGMNEQELPNLHSFLKHGNVSIISETYPRVATVLDQMRESYKLLREQHGRVSRLHIHTLAFQAILTRHNSRWKNTMSAAAHASLTANRHVCGTQKVDVKKSKLLMDESFSLTREEETARMVFYPKKPVSCWDEDYTLKGVNQKERVTICVAPNLVCTAVYQTAGGGDNISAAGLAAQL